MHRIESQFGGALEYNMIADTRRVYKACDRFKRLVLLHVVQGHRNGLFWTDSNVRKWPVLKDNTAKYSGKTAKEHCHVRHCIQ